MAEQRGGRGICHDAEVEQGGVGGFVRNRRTLELAQQEDAKLQIILLEDRLRAVDFASGLLPQSPR